MFRNHAELTNRAGKTGTALLGRQGKKSGTAMTDETLMDARHDRSIIIDYNALRSFRVATVLHDAGSNRATLFASTVNE